MENKKKTNKKNNVKNIVFKVLHLVGYLSTLILTILFIVMGVQSCNNNNNQQKQKNNVVEVQKPKQNYIDNGNYSLTINNSEFISYDIENFVYQNINNLHGYVYGRRWATDQYLDYTISFNVISVNNDYLPQRIYTFGALGSARAEVRVYLNDNSNLYTGLGGFGTYISSGNTRYEGFILGSIRFNNMTNTQYNTLKGLLIGGGYTEEDLEDSYNQGYVVGYDDGYAKSQEVIESFMIDAKFDFRYLISNTIDSNTGLMKMSNFVNDTSAYRTLLTGLTFTCNNVEFNCVDIQYLSVGQLDNFYNLSTQEYESSTSLFGSNYGYYRFLTRVYFSYYENINDIENSTSVRSLLVFKGYDEETLKLVGGATGIGYNCLSPKWVNGGFRSIKVVSNNDTLVSTPVYQNTFTTLQLLTLESTDIISSTESMLDMFQLFRVAFGSVSGLLNIAILPNITLGLLLFLPLVVGVIIIILKMIKK